MCGAHPVALSIASTERQLNRLTMALRPSGALPVLIVLGIGAGASIDWTRGEGRATAASAGGVLVFGPLLMILARCRHPGWWFAWRLSLLRSGTPVAASKSLLDDRSGSADGGRAMRRPDAAAGDVSRGLPLVKWLLALPHDIVLAFLWSAVSIAVVVDCFVVLFARGFRQGLFDLVVGVGHWDLRVVGHPFVVAADAYPPFGLAL